MKLLLITLFALSSLAQDPSKKTNQKDPTKEKITVSKIKTDEIDAALDKTPEVADCRKSKTPNCVEDIVNSLDPKKLDAIAKDLGSSAFQVDGGKKSDAIKNFMQERISKLVYGDTKDDDKSKPPKVVGHDIYRKIYKNQLGKNMLLDINTYCLENMGYKNKDNAITGFDYVDDTTKPLMKNGKAIPNKYEPKELYGIKLLDNIRYKKVIPNVSGVEIPVSNLNSGNTQLAWIKKFTEHAKGNNPRSKEDIKNLKSFYLSEKLGNGQPLATYVSGFCRDYVIKTACVAYKCRNTDTNNLGEEEEKQCQAMGITYSSIPTPNGQVACSLVSRLESYKKTFTALNDQDSALNKLNDQTSGFDGSVETIQKDINEIDKITTVASKDLSNNVSEIKDAEDKAKEFEDKCKNESGDCVAQVNGLNDDESDSITMEMDLANKIYANKVKLAQGSEDDLRKFLEENNLTEKYGKKLDEIGKDDLAKLITNDYISKKDALKQSMMDKFKASTASSNPAQSSNDYTQNLAEKVKEIKEDKDYVETMYEYNNIVSSYLQFNDKDGKDLGTMKAMRESEFKDLDKYAKTPEERDEYERYQDLFVQGDTSKGLTGKGADVNFLGFLDSVLGN